MLKWVEERRSRRALTPFGGVQQHREVLREGRGTAWFGSLSLDLRLGVRMLVKYPGPTIVGGLVMAFGNWFGTVTFEMLGMVEHGAVLRPWACRAYVNYLAPSSPERIREVYGVTYPRLARIKAQYDPANLFRSNQNVQPARGT